MIRILAIALAASAALAAATTAEAHGRLGFGSGAYGPHSTFSVVYRGAVVSDDEDDDDDSYDDDDDDDDEDTSRRLVVDDYEDCAPGKFLMVEMADIEVPVACH
jgi:hypothetical protein